MLWNARISARFGRVVVRCGYVCPFDIPKSTLLPPARTNHVWALIVPATAVSARESNDFRSDSAQVASKACSSGGCTDVGGWRGMPASSGADRGVDSPQYQFGARRAKYLRFKLLNNDGVTFAHYPFAALTHANVTTTMQPDFCEFRMRNCAVGRPVNIHRLSPLTCCRFSQVISFNCD